MAALTVAGCSSTPDLTNQIELDDREFGASPVGLPEDGRRELALAEVARDSGTTSRAVDQVDEELAFTSEYGVYDRGAAYGRAPFRSPGTLMDAFLGRVNGTAGPGPASVIAGRDLGIGEVTVPNVFGDSTDSEGDGGEPLSVSGDQLSLVVPAGARTAEGLSFDQTTPLLYVSDPVPEEVAVQTGGFNADATNWFPGEMWLPNEHFCPDHRWLPRSNWVPEDSTDLQVLVLPGERDPEEVFGRAAEELPLEGVQPGRTFEPSNPFLIAMPGGDALLDAPEDAISLREDSPIEPRALHEDDPLISPEVLDAGVPAPTGGATFGFGVLSTPRAEVGGRVLNPLAGGDLREVIQDDLVGGLLAQAGLTDADRVEWTAGPDEVSVPNVFGVGIVPEESRELGGEVEAVTMGGVVRGQDGPWGVGLHVARVQTESDAVIAAGVQRTPSPNEIPWPSAMEDHLWATWFQRAAGLSARTVDLLARA